MQLILLQKDTVHVFHQGFHPNSSFCTGVIHGQNLVFLLLCQNPDWPVMRRTYHWISDDSLFNAFIPQNFFARFLPWRSQMKAINQQQTISNKNIWMWFPNENPDSVENRKMCYEFWLRSTIKLIFFDNWRFDFDHWDISIENLLLAEMFNVQKLSSSFIALHSQ